MTALATGDVALARAVERQGLDVWRAPGEMDFDGWRVKIAGGFSHRLDSVTPVERGTIDAASKIHWCERFYNERQLPCTVRLTALYDDDLLEQWLIARGYQAKRLTRVLVKDLTGSENEPPPGLSFSDTPGDDWFTTAMLVDRRAVLHAEAMIFVMTHMPARKVFVEAGGADGTVAIGCGQVQDGRLGIFSMRTAPQEQRKGHGRRVLSGLLAWGRTQGAEHAWLQVEEGNTAALALYRSVGFRDLYDYRYLVRHEARD